MVRPLTVRAILHRARASRFRVKNPIASMRSTAWGGHLAMDRHERTEAIRQIADVGGTRRLRQDRPFTEEAPTRQFDPWRALKFGPCEQAGSVRKRTSAVKVAPRPTVPGASGERVSSTQSIRAVCRTIPSYFDNAPSAVSGQSSGRCFLTRCLHQHTDPTSAILN
jgi:hypothetical protein